MKKIYTIVIALFTSAIVFAQAPQKMSYQAVIRDASNNLVTTHSVGMKISILQGSATGTAVYTVTQTPTTNANGLVSIEFGGGTGFESIDWSTGTYFIQTETDPTGGTNYTIKGTSQLLSVPYALYAKTAGSAFSGKFSDLTGIPSNLINTTTTPNNGDLLYFNGTGWQLLSVGNNGQVLKIEDGLPSWQQLSVNGSPMPKAVFIVSHLSASTSQTIQVDASASSDDVDAMANLECRWRWNDGESFTAWTNTKTLSYQYDTEGDKNITLEIKDSQGNIGTSSKSIVINNLLFNPLIVTNPVTSVMQTSATSGGTILANGGADITASGVCWSTTQNPTITDSKTIDGHGLGSFTSTISGLTAGKTYYLRGYATNSNGTYYGNQISFQTVLIVNFATLETSTPLNITTNSATCGGEITDEGGATVIERGVCWSTTQNPSIIDNKVQAGSGIGLFSCSLTNLQGGATLYARAYATNSAGTNYGNQVSFMTSKVLPIVTTKNIASLTSISAASGGVITSTGGGTISDKGICWSESQNPTVTDNTLSAGTDQTTYNQTMTLLLPNTVYYVRAYATNEIGTSYGGQKTFTTTDAYYEGFENGIPSSYVGQWSLNTTDGQEGNSCLYVQNIGWADSISRTLVNPGQISFYTKNASYQGDCVISFFIDNVKQADFNNSSWELKTFTVTAGKHTFKWQLNDSFMAGNASGYIDYIVMPK